MSGYMMVMAPCFSCRRVFMSNPNTVPSYHGEPVCRDCMETINRHRVELGNPPFPIAPDAYDPAPEDGLP